MNPNKPTQLNRFRIHNKNPHCTFPTFCGNATHNTAVHATLFIPQSIIRQPSSSKYTIFSVIILLPIKPSQCPLDMNTTDHRNFKTGEGGGNPAFSVDKKNGSYKLGMADPPPLQHHHCQKKGEIRPRSQVRPSQRPIFSSSPPFPPSLFYNGLMNEGQSIHPS